MREILFRSKRNDNGEWVYGDLMHKHYNFDTKATKVIHNNIMNYKVIPETIGQYTGMRDKNGKKIFEGDIFKMEDEIVAVIIFHEGCFRLQTWGLCGTYTESGYDECGGGWGIIECEPIDWYYIHDMEVIGNIHDNPEMLEVENA